MNKEEQESLDKLLMMDPNDLTETQVEHDEARRELLTGEQRAKYSFLK